MQYGCIGEKLGHSFSAVIHNMLGEYDYRLTELSRDEVEEFMLKKDFKGINVTIPYKETVIPFLDTVDKSAADIGAVNTIVNNNGKLIGYNTDFYGMSELILRARIDVKGKNVAILGTGGTSKTAKAVSVDMGAKSVVKVSRTPESDDEISYEELYRRAGSIEIIINTTPVGMYPKSEGIPIDLLKFPSIQGVVDVIYNPLSTNLVLEARSIGVSGENGLYMLVAQAAKAAALFFDDSSMTEKTDEVFYKILRQKRNIVLVGMPGCGKSTVGKALAKKLNCSFVDSDDEIEKESGMSIPEIFEKYGEKDFRDRESSAIERISKENGTVIATGGGAVLRKENVKALQRNGTVVFLDRRIEDIVPTSDRPLGRSREALEARYRERYPIYCEVADIKIDVDSDIEGVSQKIIEAFKNEYGEKLE